MAFRRFALVCTALLFAGCRSEPESRTVSVAVAANFASVQSELAQRFTQKTGASVRASVGSTGQLYAQIKNGAPFGVLLSADAERPQQLEAESLALKGSRFTYAVGQLALYAPRSDTTTATGPELLKGKFAHLAIANPKLAPYGVAAIETLQHLGMDTTLAGRVVQGENIAQVLQFVKSGAADLGFVAYSQVVKEPARSYWLVPADHHGAIVQDAVLLRAAEHNSAARAYLDFLQSLEAQEIIRSYGYAVPPQR